MRNEEKGTAAVFWAGNVRTSLNEVPNLPHSNVLLSHHLGNYVASRGKGGKLRGCADGGIIARTWAGPHELISAKHHETPAIVARKRDPKNHPSNLPQESNPGCPPSTARLCCLPSESHFLLWPLHGSWMNNLELKNSSGQTGNISGKPCAMRVQTRENL